MTALHIDPRTSPRTALCYECGHPRSVDAKWVRDRSFVCDQCNTRTPHAIVGTEPAWDWRELENEKPDPDRMRLHQLINFVTDFGISVYWSTRVEGGVAQVNRYMNRRLVMNEWEGDRRRVRATVCLNPNLSTDKKIDALRWAWKTVLPSDTWDKCPVINDSRLGPSVGIYRS